MNFLKTFTYRKRLHYLNNRENKLFKATIKLYETDKSRSSIGLRLVEIFDEYAKIHYEYSKICHRNLEALKRALFIQWYCYSEPQYLTGIGNLIPDIEIQVLTKLKKWLDKKNVDEELLWMLNYYVSFDERLYDIYIETFNYKAYINETATLPSEFKNNNRGQMGKYWDSIINR